MANLAAADWLVGGLVLAIVLFCFLSFGVRSIGVFAIWRVVISLCVFLFAVFFL